MSKKLVINPKNSEVQSNYYTSRPEYSKTIIEAMINFWKYFNDDRQT